MIIAALVALEPLFHGADAALRLRDRRRSSGRSCSSRMCAPGAARASASSFAISLDWRDPRVRQVLQLMLPVTIGLGLINFDLLDQLDRSARSSPTRRRRAIDEAFRIYMLPAGHVQRRGRDRAVPDALAPRRARRPRRPARARCGNGVRQIALLLIPRRGRHCSCSPSRSRGSSTSAASSTPQSTDARLRGAVLVLVLAAVRGVNLLLTRTFFCLQRPWIADRARGRHPGRQRRPCRSRSTSRSGSPASCIGTAVASAAMTVAQALLPARASCGGLRDGARRCGRSRGCSSPRVAARRRRLRRLVRRSTALLGRSLLGADRLGRLAALAPASRSTPACRARRCRIPRGAADRASLRRARRDAGAAPRNLVVPPWPTRHTSATSRSSPTSTTGSRRWPTASSR